MPVPEQPKNVAMQVVPGVCQNCTNMWHRRLPRCGFPTPGRPATHLTQTSTASTDLSSSAHPRGSLFRLRTKKRSSRSLRASCCAAEEGRGEEGYW
eukprot:363889-Chlamydomonas_euryale.AAC.1